MKEDAPDSREGDRHRRGLKFRRRDDYAVELFREAEDHLADIPHVDRVLLQLGRFYNPYSDAPIVDLATRRRIVESLQQGDEATARTLLRDCLDRYVRPTGAGGEDA